MSATGPTRVVSGLLFAALALPAALAAQQFPGFGGIGFRAAVVTPDDAKTGLGMSADLDLGYFRMPKLRTLVGINYFKADVDRRVGGNATGGSITGTGGSVGLRFDPMPGARLSPYIGAGLTGLSVNAEVADAGTRELLDGFYIGAAVSGGFAFAVDTMRRLSVVAGARRVFVTNTAHTAYEIGVRWSPRGAGTYSASAGERRDEERRLAREREEARVTAERALAARDSAATAQSRQDAERLRAQDQRDETARAAREREEADRLERERLERERLERERTERERTAQEQRDRLAAQQQQQQQQQQAQSQAEIDRLRRQADSLRTAQATEATARVAAEAEAAAARARASAADSAARAAEARATDAERRRYEALLDLDRLIGNVTEIRETERGLAVVLGQGLFATGQHNLSAAARAEIGTIAAVLAQYENSRIAVEGHTDSVGQEVSNQRLSERRAEAVRAALIGKGIQPSQIDMAGLGQGRPIADNATAEGRARNRRVEIIVIGAQRPGGRTPGQR